MSTDIFAAALAESDAESQAQFINNFYRHLKMCSKGKQETQVCYIADFLDENGREFAKDLNTFSNLAVESRAKLETAVAELYSQKHELEREIASLRDIRESTQ